MKFGADVPFLRSKKASTDTAMEHDILNDLYLNFKKLNIKIPDLIVWLRPTFVFRNLEHVNECIDLLTKDKTYTAARTICAAESRLYKKVGTLIKARF